MYRHREGDDLMSTPDWDAKLHEDIWGTLKMISESEDARQQDAKEYIKSFDPLMQATLRRYFNHPPPVQEKGLTRDPPNLPSNLTYADMSRTNFMCQPTAKPQKVKAMATNRMGGYSTPAPILRPAPEEQPMHTSSGGAQITQALETLVEALLKVERESLEKQEREHYRQQANEITGTKQFKNIDLPDQVKLLEILVGMLLPANTEKEAKVLEKPAPVASFPYAKRQDTHYGPPTNSVPPPATYDSGLGGGSAVRQPFLLPRGWTKQAPEPDKSKKFKTQMCKHWRQSRCPYGDRCTFAHGDLELWGDYSLSKPKWKINNQS